MKERNPNISYFKAFGCKCFTHNNGKDNLGMFDARSDKDIFRGYFLHSKEYKVINKCTNYVKESGHIVFDELNTIPKASS